MLALCLVEWTCSQLSSNGHALRSEVFAMQEYQTNDILKATLRTVIVLYSAITFLVMPALCANARSLAVRFKSMDLLLNVYVAGQIAYSGTADGN